MERDNKERSVESRRMDALEMGKIDRGIKKEIFLGVTAVCGAVVLGLVGYFILNEPFTLFG